MHEADSSICSPPSGSGSRIVAWCAGSCSWDSRCTCCVIVIAFFNHSKSGDPHPPFLFGTTAGDGAVAMGVATAIFMYIIGTTYAGAEWSQRTIVALLFWEPRRWRVMQAKILVVAIVSTVLTVVTQLIWLATRPGPRIGQG